MFPDSSLYSTSYVLNFPSFLQDHLLFFIKTPFKGKDMPDTCSEILENQPNLSRILSISPHGADLISRVSLPLSPPNLMLPTLPPLSLPHPLAFLPSSPLPPLLTSFQLLQKSPAKRLTDISTIKGHPFFQEITWQDILDKKHSTQFLV